MVTCFGGLQQQCVQHPPHICCYMTRTGSISHGDIYTASTWIQVLPDDKPAESNKGHPTDQSVPVDQTLASPAALSAIMQVLHSFQPFLPCITAVTEQQAILAVTSATHLTEGWIILSIITPSYRVVNRNLNTRGIHILRRMSHFLKFSVTLTVPAAKVSKSK